MENTGQTTRLLPSLPFVQILNIQETSSYVNTHMNEILTEAFINMFAVNPDIQDKFFKDYIGDVQNESDQKDNRKYKSQTQYTVWTVVISERRGLTLCWKL